jgi:alpha-glucosidase
MSDHWAHDAVIYQIYPRSFADGDGDGSGDLRGIINRLDHIADLGVDAIWLSPFYPSPQNDAGYDVSDYQAVDPLYGDLSDVDELISIAHTMGLRVLVDLVPNHTSSAHHWFVEALAGSPGSPAREFYLFRDGRGEHGELPPNNWTSVFGGPAWTRTDGEGQWYLHLFDSSQPDLNWDNPAVREAFEQIVRFWLDRGVDGFRVDVAHGLAKAPGLPDLPEGTDRPGGAMGALPTGAGPYFDQEAVHEIYREWRSVLDSYPGQRILVAEAWVEPLERLFRYVRPGEMDQVFNFTFLMAGHHAPALFRAIDDTFNAAADVGSPATWVLSNHDTVRHSSRYGLERVPAHQRGIGPADPQPDLELGRRRAAAMASIELALPGSAYVYQGDELGLPEHTQLADADRRDPVFNKTCGEELGRDGARIPLPWSQDAPHLGFGTRASDTTWLPQPGSYRSYAVDAQSEDDDSMLSLYRRLISLRRRYGLGRGGFAWHRLNRPERDVIAFSVSTHGTTTVVIANLGLREQNISEFPLGRIILESRTGALRDTVISGSATVWIVLD